MEAVGKLAGGIAHDFNNLLTAIMGYSELLLNRLGESDTMRVEMEEIRKAAERAAALTRQLLAFSRQQVLQPKVLNLNTVVLEIEKMLCRLIGEHIDLKTTLASGLGDVRVDPNQIEQILMNLAVNARDAMPEGGTLTISTNNIELDSNYARRHLTVIPGPYVTLSVTDSGVGMSPEVKARLFEPFFTTKERGKGTGLGLSTVYGIVRQSGGDIAITSELGKGTCVQIHLPRVQATAETGSAKIPAHQIPKGNETILVVEDEETLRQMVSTVLREQGYSVLEAFNGEDALRIANQQNGHRIGLVLTDVLMPRMGGKELSDRLRDRWPGLKVLFVSGYTENNFPLNGVLEEGVAFLSKPFTLAGLAMKVREFLDSPGTNVKG
jgi:CheY-like chemotaxis protein